MIDRTIKIERGVPLPEVEGRASASRYPWAQMRLGERFVISAHTKPKPRPKTLRHLADHYSRKHTGGTWKFSVRVIKPGKDPLHPEGGVGVWRIK